MEAGLLRDLLTVLLGVATGVLSGTFGVGGAVISTPGIRLLGAGPLVAVGTTLPSILPGAISGVLRYRDEDLIRWRIVAVTVPAGLVAAVLGALAAEVIPGNGHLLQLATAALLAVSARRMFRDPDESTDRAEGHASAVRFAGIGAVAGGLSGLLGIGGGVVMVPAFVHLTAVPVKAAIATSLACVGLFAIPGTITHALLDNIDWRFAFWLTVGVIPGARLGASLTIAAAERRVRRTVAVFLGITAVIYATGELVSLLS